jgi:glutathione S-transferase
MSKLTLYALPGACSLASHIALEWIATLRPHFAQHYSVEVLDRANFPTPEFVAKVFTPTVPALITREGSVISESLAVLLHIADFYPEIGLAPRLGASGRDKLHTLLSFMVSAAHPSFQMMWRPERFTDSEEAHAAVARMGEVRLDAIFDRLNHAIDDADWLVGTSLTVADFYLFVLGRWGMRLRKPTQSYANVWRITDALAQTEAVRRALTREGITFEGPAAGLG